VKFSLSLVAVIALIALVVGVVGGRAAGGSSSSSGGGSGGKAAGKKVDVIIKASDSSFWQTMLAGASKAGGDYGLKVGLFGPTSETDINQQVQLIENSISRGADAIVLAANSSNALNSAIKRARKAGIKVVTGLKACPGLRVATTRYNNNDLNTAASQVNDVLTANPGLVGVFADNNTSGTGAARAIKDNKAADRIPVVAFDTDPQENAALTDGSIDALVVQNPYFFGYQGVVQAGMAAVGSQPPLILDPGAVVADKANMASATIKPLLNPPTAKAQ
jgi:ribose transport system substrate-binding protein